MLPFLQRYLFAAVGNGFKVYDVIAYEGMYYIVYDYMYIKSLLWYWINVSTILFVVYRQSGSPQTSCLPDKCTPPTNHLHGVSGEQVYSGAVYLSSSVGKVMATGYREHR